MKYLLLFLGNLTILYGITRLGGAPFGHHIKFFVNLIYGFSLLYPAKFFNKKILYFTLTFLPVIIITLLIFNNNDYRFFRVSTLSTLAFYIGFLFAFLQNKFKLSLILLVPIILAFNFFILLRGYDIWIHKLNYGTYTGKVHFDLSEDFYLLDSSHNKKTFNRPNQIYVLEFWSTTCGVCIKEFPTIQQFYSENKDKIEFYSVNVPYSNQTYSKIKDFILKRSLNVPLLLSPISPVSLNDSLQINAYPLTIIIRNGKIIHYGNIFSARHRIKEIK